MKVFVPLVLSAYLSFFVGIASEEPEPLKYGLYAKKEGVLPIEKVEIFGERCSGTNYLLALTQENFALSSKKWVWDFGWKHFPVWIDGGAWFDPILTQRGGSPFTNLPNENYLFIVIFRNPYDWLHSFFETPHHAHESFKKKTIRNFSRFIREPWVAEEKWQWIDSNPSDGSHFKNVIQLRTAKIKNMLKIADHVHNIYYVNYETLKNFPIDVMMEIATYFDLFCKTFTDVKEICQPGGKRKGVFVPKVYPSLKINDLLYINSQLDEELEQSIGYQLIMQEV